MREIQKPGRGHGRMEPSVRDVQDMLCRLAKQYSFLPELTVDGVFGEKTLEAVMLFQRELYPPVTGVVDPGTWNAMWTRWLGMAAHQPALRPLRVCWSRAVVPGPSRHSDHLMLCQMLFQVLRGYLEGILPDPPDGQHGEASEKNVRWLQRCARLEETGKMDRATWNALVCLYEWLEATVLPEKREETEPIR